MPPKTQETDPDSFKNFVDLMAIFADASNQLAAMENDLQDEFIKLVDDRRGEYAELQRVIGESEESLEMLAVLNPQWFKKGKTLKTPYGSVAFRSSTSLDVKNEEVTIVLIEQRGEEDQELYLRTKTELNLEALEKLDDAELKKLRIVRVTKDTCKVTHAKINLGKAVATAKEGDDKAA